MSDKRKYHAYYRNVMSGSLDKTPGGLTKNDIMVIQNTYKKSSPVRYISEEKHNNGVKNFHYIAGWAEAVKNAREKLKIKGFQVIGGETPEGKELLRVAHQFYGKYKK